MLEVEAQDILKNHSSKYDIDLYTLYNDINDKESLAEIKGWFNHIKIQHQNQIQMH